LDTSAAPAIPTIVRQNVTATITIIIFFIDNLLQNIFLFVYVGLSPGFSSGPLPEINPDNYQCEA
jgi:hypothetical protein